MIKSSHFLEKNERSSSKMKRSRKSKWRKGGNIKDRQGKIVGNRRAWLVEPGHRRRINPRSWSEMTKIGLKSDFDYTVARQRIVIKLVGMSQSGARDPRVGLHAPVGDT